MYNYLIQNFKKTDNNYSLATFTIASNGFKISGCKLMYSKNKDKYYISVPGFKWKDKYFTYVGFERSLYDDVLNQVVSLYKKPAIDLLG